VSLRTRLTLFFVVIVLLPLIVVAAGLRAWFAGSLADQTRAELHADQRAALAVLRVRSAQAAGVAGLLAADTELADALARRDLLALRDRAARGAVGGFTVAVADPAGRILVSRGPLPGFLPGVEPPGLQEALDAAPDDPSRALFVREEVDVVRSGCRSSCGLGQVVTGFWADDDELDRLRAGSDDRDLSLTLDGRLVASTNPRAASVTLGPVSDGLTGGPTRLTLGGRRDEALATAWFAPFQSGQTALVVSQPVEAGAAQLRRLGWGLALLVVLVAVLAGVLGVLLARLVSEPLRDLAVGVRRIAGGGDLGRPPPQTRAPGEVGELARAFDAMRLSLGRHVDALRSSRDELTRSMAMVGETMASTNDLPKLLGVVVEAAVEARQASSGTLLLFDAQRAMLVPHAVWGLLPDQVAPVAAGEGVVGAVAVSGRPVVLPGHGTGPVPVAGEPVAPTQVSVPLRSRGLVLGVLSVYGRDAGGPFGDDDARALAAFAGQAAVGIENVRLHEEARHLSMTDELTSIWNLRYFRLRIDQEIERARRFRRDLSLLVVDVDRFKAINDKYGHQQGDQILRELTSRVSGSIRDVDTFARYGGEEFVLILPETDIAGARAAAEKIRLGIASRPFRIRLEPGDEGGNANGEEAAQMLSLRVSISVGVACYPLHAGSADPLIAAADAAMYKAKTGGRDQVVVAEPGPGAGDPTPGQARRQQRG
jgi:diguanylate cyclase (GGDEF)-like protein